MTDHDAPPTTPTGEHATIDGIGVYHEVAGPPDAPAVLLSHHFYGSVGTWRHVIAGLADTHRVVAFDRPGFGRTERPRRHRWQGGRSPYTREAAARIGWGLLDHLGIEDAVLVGSSAGGTSVLEMYARAPERVRGLALLSPAITGDVGAPPRYRRLLRSPLFHLIGPAVVRRFAGEIDRDRVARGWHDPSRASDDDLAPYRDLLEADGWARGLWGVLTAEPPPDLRQLVATIEVPTVVIGGSSDRVIPAAANRRTAAAIPGARSVELPGCGHTPQEECPERLVEELRGFVAGL